MKTILFALAISIASVAFAQQKNAQNIASQLTDATIYFGYGAELNHTAKASLVAGLQEIVLTGVAADIDQNTIQVGCPENVVLMSYRFNVKPIATHTNKTPLSEKMEDTLKLLLKQQAAIYNDYSTTEDLLNRTTKIIESNLADNPKKGVSGAELIRLTEYYTAKVESYKNNLYATQLKKNDADEKVAGIRLRINDNNTKGYVAAPPEGQIILQIMAQAAVNATFSLSYFTSRAGWLPTYDLRIKTIDNNLKLSYKASVTQSTGIDWKGVKLTLSTGNPNQGGTIPAINPWFVSMYAPVLYEQMKSAVRKQAGYKKEIIAEKDEAAAPMATTDLYMDKSVESGNIAAYTNISESRLNTSFEIDLPYDIPSDNKAYSVSVKDEMIKADYKHYAIPKFDNDAFLMAEISDWETLNLLPGNANIIMDNVYLGKTFIDPNSTQDTLRLPLGRDKRIAIKRVLVKEFSKNKIKGDYKTEAFTYEITVKNNKKQPVEMVLTDQYPLSRIKEVEVILDNNGNANINTETGALEWRMKLEAGESRNVRFAYTVKYPKNKIIQNLR